MGSEEKASRDFYELCYDQYKLELEEAENLYQKVAIVLIVLPLLAGTTIAIGRIDLLSHMFLRADVSIYYFSCAVSFILILISATFAIYCVVPRDYKRIHDMANWKEWRIKYQKYIEESKVKETVDDAMIIEVCARLADAQTKNAPTNERRRRYFYKSVLMASLCIVPLVIQAIFYLLLKMQGI